MKNSQPDAIIKKQIFLQIYIRRVLPVELLRQIQDYVDGEYIYIPRLVANRKKRGGWKNSYSMLKKRNLKIYRKYKSGVSVKQLSEIYYISPQGIYKILSTYKA